MPRPGGNLALVPAPDIRHELRNPHGTSLTDIASRITGHLLILIVPEILHQIIENTTSLIEKVYRCLPLLVLLQQGPVLGHSTFLNLIIGALTGICPEVRLHFQETVQDSLRNSGLITRKFHRITDILRVIGFSRQLRQIPLQFRQFLRKTADDFLLILKIRLRFDFRCHKRLLLLTLQAQQTCMLLPSILQYILFLENRPA